MFAILVTNTPPLNRPSLTGEAAILKQMADDMRERAAVAGGVTKDDLETMGWPPKTVEQYGRAAARRATRRSLRESTGR